MTWQVIHADCIEAISEMDEASVDAIVTDPPYALEGGFMGKAWDRFKGREDTGFGYYLAGLIDGEGSFRVQRHERGSHTCAFGLTLRSDDRATLTRAQRFLGHGTVNDMKESGRSRPCSRWNVQDKAGCLALVGMLRRFPLHAKKGIEFEVWAAAVEEWAGRPRGNRWHGPADQAQAERFKARIERLRDYRDPPWSGHPFQDWTRTWAEEALRVLKPGGHALVMGGTRTFHRTTSGLEDAGFEIRDCLSYLYGSGFPKSLNLGNGWGTALKPAWEAVVLARKPLVGSVASNVQAYGTGALNIDGTRIGTEGGTTRAGESTHLSPQGAFTTGHDIEAIDGGRWPPNVVLDPEAAALLDEQTGELHPPGTRSNRANRGPFSSGDSELTKVPAINDYGGASRFFKQISHEEGTDVLGREPRPALAGTQGGEGEEEGEVRFRYEPKADREERDRGLEHRAASPAPSAVGMGKVTARDWGDPDQKVYERHTMARNPHPTVKPVELMRWLCRLVTPPGGTVLDPFTGSGSTGIAALREGFNFVGIEREADYVEIARDRIIGDAPLWNVQAEVTT